MDGNEPESEPYDGNARFCSDCELLTEALRELEAERREAEDQLWTQRGQREQELGFAKIARLERRRNCALEMLFKHQRLEHQT